MPFSTIQISFNQDKRQIHKNVYVIFHPWLCRLIILYHYPVAQDEKTFEGVLDQYWANEVRNMNECPDTTWMFMGLIRNFTAHSVLWPILPTAVTIKITWPSRAKIKPTKLNTTISPCFVHLHSSLFHKLPEVITVSQQSHSNRRS